LFARRRILNAYPLKGGACRGDESYSIPSGPFYASVFEQFGSEAQCEAALETARWPEGFRCPICGKAGHSEFRVGARKMFQCRACRTQTSLIAGTLFQSTHLGLTTWFLAIYLIS